MVTGHKDFFTQTVETHRDVGRAVFVGKTERKHSPGKLNTLISGILIIIVVSILQYSSSGLSSSLITLVKAEKQQDKQVNKTTRHTSSYIYPTYTSEIYAGRADYLAFCDIFFKQMIPSQVDSKIIYASSTLTNSIYQYNETDKSLTMLLQGGFSEGNEHIVTGDLLMVEKQISNSLEYDSFYYNNGPKLWKYSMKDKQSIPLSINGLEHVTNLGVDRRTFGLFDFGMNNQAYGLVEGKLYQIERKNDLVWNFMLVKELDNIQTEWDGFAMHKLSNIMHLVANRTIFKVDLKTMSYNQLVTYFQAKTPIAVYQDGKAENLYYTSMYGSDNSILIKCSTEDCGENSSPIYYHDEMIVSTMKTVKIPSSFAITKDVFIFNSYFPRKDEITLLALFSLKDSISYPLYSLDGPIWNGVHALNSSIFPTAVSLLRHLDGRKELVFSDYTKIRSISMSDRKLNVVQVNNQCTDYVPELPSLLNIGSTVNPSDDSSIIYAASYPDTNAQTFSIKRTPDGRSTWCPLSSDIQNIPVPNESSLNQSMFNDPSGIVVLNDEIYIADTKSNRIRKITRDKRVITLVGGGFGKGDNLTGTEVYLNAPFGIAVDNETLDVYFSDSNNHCIKVYSQITGLVQYFAGTCGKSDVFNFPKAITLLENQFLVVADSYNHRIARINLATRLVETIIGDGQAGEYSDTTNSIRLNVPTGVHYCDGYVFVADTNNHRILKIAHAMAEEPTDSSVEIIATIDDLKLSYPHGIHAFKIGYKLLYAICNTYDNRVVVAQESPTRFFTEIGSGLPGYNGDRSIFEVSFSNPKGAWFDEKSQLLYFSDSANNLIRKIDIVVPLVPVETVAGGHGDGGSVLNTRIKITSFAQAPEGTIVTDVQNNLIRLIKPDGTISTLIGSGGTLYNGEEMEAKLTNLNYPYGVQVLGNDIYFSDSKNIRIRKLSDGIVSTILIDPSYPSSPKVKNNGDIIYASQTGIKIYYAKTKTIQFIQEFNLQKNSIEYDSDDGSVYYPTDTAIIKLTPSCPSGYVLDSMFSECNPVCFGYSQSNLATCSGNGECWAPDSCYCSEQYTGIQCQHPKCFGLDITHPTICNGKGRCTSVDECKCQQGYSGIDCSIPECFGISGNSSCGGTARGKCVSLNICLCNTPHYSGLQCELANCFGIPQNDPKVCSQNGICKSPNECICATDYYDKDCSKFDNETWTIGIGVGVSGGLVILLLILGAGLIFVLRIYKKQKRIIDTDLGLDRQLLSTEDIIDGTKTSNSSTSVEEDFYIPLNQLNMDRPIKRLGSGGIGSVFMTKWNNIIIAVKVFDLNNENIGIEDFVNEALLLSRLRHPNIISFYGVSSSPTKRYIAMECMDSSLESYIQKMQLQQISISVQTKLKMISDICRGIMYLHNLQPNFIVHRDLKPANILLDKDGNCKVCDFGLGRVLSKKTVSNITSQIGTCNYMSPEISGFSGKEIDRSHVKAIDIFSLSIIIYQVLFEVIDPYSCQDLRVVQKIGLKEPNHYESFYQLHRAICEFKVRPSIPFTDFESCVAWCREYDLEVNAEIYWKLCEYVIKASWRDEASERPSIENLVEIVESL